MHRMKLICVVGLALAGAAKAEPVRHAITPERIAAALSGSGVQIAPSQVTLMTNVVASTPDPELKVRSIDLSAGQRVIARLECARSEQCLPFTVFLQLNRDSVTPVPHANSVAVAPDVTVRAAVEVAVHKGSSARLLLNRGPVHISIPVTCMDNGAPGQSIRAVSASTHQVYTAQVVNKDVLSGRY